MAVRRGRATSPSRAVPALHEAVHSTSTRTGTHRPAYPTPFPRLSGKLGYSTSLALARRRLLACSWSTRSPTLHASGYAGSSSRDGATSLWKDGALDFGGGGEVIDGYRRIDNITDEALRRFVAAYGEEITKDDIFFYVYGLLHSPEYRETYAADLKKMLPRIPLVEDPWPFVEAGRKLSELHLGYESVTPYPLDGLDVEPTRRPLRLLPGPEDGVRQGPRRGDQEARGRQDADRLQLADRARRHPRSGLPLHARLPLGDRVDHRPLPGQDRQGLGHRQRPQRLEPAKCRTPATSSTCSPASSR